MATIAVHQRDTVRPDRSVLETTTLALLNAMAAIWIVFQAVEIQALFPPIGILYALGSIIIGGVLLGTRKAWAPAIAAAWAVLIMIPESIPAAGHLLDWSEIYTHFGHYLIIMTFFPLAVLMAVTGMAATRQNRASAVTGADAPAPLWLRPAVIAVAVFIVIANIATILLYVLDIP